MSNGTSRLGKNSFDRALCPVFYIFPNILIRENKKQFQVVKMRVLLRVIVMMIVMTMITGNQKWMKCLSCFMR